MIIKSHQIRVEVNIEVRTFKRRTYLACISTHNSLSRLYQPIHVHWCDMKGALCAEHTIPSCRKTNHLDCINAAEWPCQVNTYLKVLHYGHVQTRFQTQSHQISEKCVQHSHVLWVLYYMLMNYETSMRRVWQIEACQNIHFFLILLPTFWGYCEIQKLHVQRHFFIVVPCNLIRSTFLFFLPTNAPFINHIKC